MAHANRIKNVGYLFVIDAAACVSLRWGGGHRGQETFTQRWFDAGPTLNQQNLPRRPEQPYKKYPDNTTRGGGGVSWYGHHIAQTSLLLLAPCPYNISKSNSAQLDAKRFFAF